VRDGDMIALDVEARTLHLEVSDEVLAGRRESWTAPPCPTSGGYVKLFVDHVGQADTGADFDFLVGCRGSAIPRESH
jgi:dihydroxy-acid dehydratase